MRGRKDHMTETALAHTNGADMAPQTLEQVLLGGDIEKLNAGQRVSYMLSVCKSIGLNPLTKPFEFIKLNGRLVLYARKDCTEQLRKINGISIKIVAREYTEGVYVVTAQATDKGGRCDESVGAVPIEGLKGENKANAMMKAETKAKRRVTLSISGLGMLDESELESIPRTVADVAPEDTSLAEKLQASIALTEARKVAAQNVAAAAEVFEAEVVDEHAPAFTMPFASKEGRWEKGAPIESLETRDIKGLAKWKGARDDLKAACAAELARRGEG